MITSFFAQKIIKSVFDNHFKDKVKPVRGSIVKCELYGFEHSGVYVGNGKIVELTGEGSIRLTDAAGFTEGTNALTIYVACCNSGKPLAKRSVADRAVKKTGTNRNYNLALDNCHQFTAGCITGDFENPVNAFTMLHIEISSTLNDFDGCAWEPSDLL